MATSIPYNVVVPQNLSQPSTSTTVSQNTINLSDEIKHQVVVGIGLMNVLVPVLKKYIDHKLKKLHEDLVKTQFKEDPKQKIGSIVQQYRRGSVITDHNELAKLFLESHMAKFNKITDECFDASAALNILGRAACFSKEEKKLANKIRADVRNKWAHCNYTEWTHIKYMNSFQLMQNLVNLLPGPEEIREMFDRVKVSAELQKWKTNGLQLQGKHVESALLKKVFDEFQLTMKILAKEKMDITSFKEIETKIQTSLRNIQKKQGVLEAEQIVMKESLSNHDDRISNLESKEKKTTSAMFSIPNRNTDFSGREIELKTIRDVLNAASAEKILTICGLGGVGKTSLALEAAWELTDSFPGGIYWLTADSGEGDNTIKASLFGLARQMNQLDPNIDAKRLVDIVTGHLLEQERSLLVIDNVDCEDFSSLVQKIINGPWLRDSKTALIITSRLKEDVLKEQIDLSFRCINLQTFNLEEGVDFLRKRTDISFDQVDAQELVIEVDGLPLALDQASAYIRASKINIQNYLKQLKKEKLKILNRKKAKQPTTEVDKARLSVKSTWTMNMDCIKEEFPIAQKITYILSFLSPRCIPRTIFNPGSPKLQDLDLRDALSNDLEYVLLTLTKLSLFEEASITTIRVHRLVQEIIKEEIIEGGHLNDTLQNVQRILTYAIEVETSPSTFLSYAESDTKFNVAALHEWSMIVENTGHFLDELKKIKVEASGEMFDSNGFAKLLDHTSLYYFVLHQTERATVYRQIMNECLSKVDATEVQMYKPKFDIPRPLKEKELIWQLMAPQRGNLDGNEEKEQRAIELKEEGNIYVRKKKYFQAIEAYNISLENTKSTDLKQRVCLNLCHTFYKLNQLENCKHQAQLVLDENVNDPKGYLWLALAYNKEEEYVEGDKVKHVSKDSLDLDPIHFGELAYAFGALALHFSEQDKTMNKILSSKNIRLANTKVVPVRTDNELRQAIEQSTLNRAMRFLELKGLKVNVHGERHIILMDQGSYRLDPEIWQNLSSCVIIGNMSGPKPTLILDNYCTTHIFYQNIFINLHFKIDKNQLTIAMQEPSNSVLFLQCKFESKSPKEATPSEELKNADGATLNQLKAFLKDKVTTAEEWETRSVTYEEKKLKLQNHMMQTTRNGGAAPAVVVLSGQCAIINSEVSDCLGAGALACRDDILTKVDPLLYMKRCIIRNCCYSGVEAREYGNVFLDDCHITENEKGVLVWASAQNVLIKSCNIYNNNLEGILGNEELSYDNPTKLKIEKSKIHHNQLGISLGWLKNVDVHSNEIFGNRSWGIYLRNSNITVISQNDIFRNDSGGIRICLNRFKNTIVMKNQIHDHTGPALLQTIYFNESLDIEAKAFSKKLAKRVSPTSIDSVKIIEMDNFSYNNELSYGSLAEWKESLDAKCNFCNRRKADLPCPKCRKVKYCKDTCRKKDNSRHNNFCSYFTEKNIQKLSITPGIFIPRNNLIPNRRKKMKIVDYKGKEFIVKIAGGDNYFGLKPDMSKRPKEHDISYSMLGGGFGNEVVIYDEFRFVSGSVENEKLFQIVRQYGKLSGEQIYAKRIYLWATIIGRNKNEIEVRTDELFHDLGW